jgi:hypothetical protein
VKLGYKANWEDKVKLRGQSEIGWESREKAQRSEIEKPK